MVGYTYEINMYTGQVCLEHNIRFTLNYCIKVYIHIYSERYK